MYTFVIRPLLFLLPPETVHHLIFGLMRLAGKMRWKRNFVRNFWKLEDSSLHRKVMGIDFPNPVGLAAGFDKDGRGYNAFAPLGFGFIEIGTVTPRPQPGNPKPRLFRLPADKALINRMGFNNKGVDAMVLQLKKHKPDVIIGGNIGKNKITENAEANKDYIESFKKLHEYVDYFTINVSSPNTPGLRELQEKEPLTNLLRTLKTINSEQPVPKPIVLKIAPDLHENQLDEIIEIILETKIDGIIATNTTISRDNLNTDTHTLDKIGAGGLSGKPLTLRSREVVSYISKRTQGKFAIIAAGGIHSAEDARLMLEAGADLIQLYTGFIYEGPALILKIKKMLLQS